MTDTLLPPPHPNGRVHLPPPSADDAAIMPTGGPGHDTIDVTDAPTPDVREEPVGSGQRIVPQLRTEVTAAEVGAPPRRDRPRPLAARSVDDVATLVGAAAGSLALVWVIYEKVLPWSGTLGFFLCWFGTFLGIYAAITALVYPRPMVLDRVVGSIMTVGAAICGGAMAWTVVWIFVQGWPALTHWNFYYQDMSGVGPTDPLDRGGVFHAIVGTAIQIAIATAIALPLGVGAAVYMSEVRGRMSRTVRTVVEAMTALPDILAGLFVYVLLIITLGWDKSGLAAAIALAVTMLPIIARSTEVVLRVVPGGLREASLALGSSQWQTVRRVVLPTAKAGLATSLILGIARIAGETAPLLIVSGSSSFLNANPTKEPMNSLPLLIYSAVRAPEGQTIRPRGYGAAALLLALVLVLFVITRFLARDKAPSR